MLCPVPLPAAVRLEHVLFSLVTGVHLWQIVALPSLCAVFTSSLRWDDCVLLLRSRLQLRSFTSEGDLAVNG